MADVNPPKVLVRGEESGGRVALVEGATRPGWAGPPLHHHPFDELFYVLEGELAFQVEDEIVTRRAGEHAFAPGGVVHTFANLSDAPSRHLIVITPAGFERYFARIAADAAGEDPPEWALEPWPEVTPVGPPLGERS
jgi:quercetin dioxygenase-like cupin family protein